MTMRLQLLICAVAALLLVPIASSQDSGARIEPASADMVNPQANISYPPPVYVVRGSIDIRGTADLPDLKSFYIEVRELDLGEAGAEGMDSEEPAWFPATLPRIAAVTDDVLGAWNTASTPDGLYELRLLINAGDAGMQPMARVSPIRIENDPPEHAMAMMPQPAADDMPADEPADDMPADEPADDMPADEPAEEPAPVDPRPHVVVTVPGANVRSGDTLGYPIIYGLKQGDRAPIKGVSSWKTGWLYIELPNGRSGFIAPFIVEVEGDISDVPAVQPPPLPPTPVPPPPPATTVPPPPASGANLVIDGGPVVNPHPATCNEAYTISVRVKNIGTERAGGGLIEIVDSRFDGQGREVTYTAFRELDPGQSAESQATITAKVHHSELHHINLHVDYDNRVQETNENDNRSAAAPYVLQKGNC